MTQLSASPSHATCAGCFKIRPLVARELNEPNPDGDEPFNVAMCDDCWAKYDGPNGDKYAWGHYAAR